MSGWRIVPVAVTDERAATAVMAAHEAGYPMIAVSVAREVIKADIAAAPAWEPSDEVCNRLFKALTGRAPKGANAALWRNQMREALKAALGGDK